jgi:hypothetical protein
MNEKKEKLKKIEEEYKKKLEEIKNKKVSDIRRVKGNEYSMNLFINNPEKFKVMFEDNSK